ncbi:LAETG motif-containing sortase-dependent surface protein [Streptomyces sp. TR02-1]|uniref:LAETG motif-containing sortase-dependent surface protein n=1 Tax=Streptomyces sp. TR02-1 TaxID=3385977 RepID=UPI00399FB6BE
MTIPAHAEPSDGGTGSPGEATAVSATTDLEVSVLGGVKVPVTASLNAVEAPEDADRTLLTADVQGVADGQPVRLVKAEVAHSSAKADASRATGAVKLVGVRAFAPGLTLKPLVKADLLEAEASCVRGQKPAASAELEDIEVLGEPVDVEALKSSQGQEVKVPGVGNVDLELEQVTTTEEEGAATALSLSYAVNPLNLGVVKASGEITLAEATCAMPTAGEETSGGTTGGSEGSSGGESGGTSGAGGAAGTGGSEGSDSGSSSGGGATPQTGEGTDLAETGAGSATVLVGGIGAAVLFAGGATLFLMRRRSAAQGG